MEKAQQNRRGITLTETVIVLGVIGIVAGAIWATASVVKSRAQMQEAVETVTQIADNVRGVYTGFPNVAAASMPTTTALQIAANLFPAAVVNGGVTVTPWGGNGTYVIEFPAAPRLGFAVQVNLPTGLDAATSNDACLGMVTRLSGTATNYGGGFAGAGDLPSGALPANPAQGGGPALVFVKPGAGAWLNVTPSTVSAIATALGGANACTGVSYYFLF